MLQKAFGGVIVGGTVSEELPGKLKKPPIRLKDKHFQFLRHIARGLKLSEAHKLAGFNGNAHSANSMFHRLQLQLRKMQEDEGFTRTRIIAECLKMLDLPCVDRYGKGIQGLTPAEKLNYLDFMEKLLPSRRREVPRITAFIINKSDGTPSRALAGPVIEAEVIPTPSPILTMKPKKEPKPKSKRTMPFVPSISGRGRQTEK